MGIIELFLTGVGLSMDAFAVSICKGLGMKKINWKQALLVALKVRLCDTLLYRRQSG